MKQIILFIVFIFTTMTCTFARNSNSSPTTKVKDEKNSEQILENNKDQFGISSKGIFGKLIKGIVYDAGTREPIIGANVVELGTSNGTVTDIDGQYSLRVSNASQKILVASYIGYVTQAQKIGGHEVVNFFLVEDTQTLQK